MSDLNRRPTVYKYVKGLRDKSRNLHDDRINTKQSSIYRRFRLSTEKRTVTQLSCCKLLQTFRGGFLAERCRRLQQVAARPSKAAVMPPGARQSALWQGSSKSGRPWFRPKSGGGGAGCASRKLVEAGSAPVVPSRAGPGFPLSGRSGTPAAKRGAAIGIVASIRHLQAVFILGPRALFDGLFRAKLKGGFKGHLTLCCQHGYSVKNLATCREVAGGCCRRGPAIINLAT